MNVDSLDGYEARKRFGLSGSSSPDQLTRKVMELAGTGVDISALEPGERSMLHGFAIALGSAANLPWKREAAELRTAAREAAALLMTMYPAEVIRSVSARLYPKGGREPVVVLAAIGYRALDLAADIKVELDEDKRQEEGWAQWDGRHEDSYAEMADRNRVWLDDID